MYNMEKQNAFIFGIVFLIGILLISFIGAEINKNNCTEVSCFSDVGVEYENDVLNAFNNSEWVPVIIEIPSQNNSLINNILSNLSGSEFQLKEKLLGDYPFAGNITQAGFDKLLKNPDVKSIYLSRESHLLPIKNKINFWIIILPLMIILLIIIFCIIFNKKKNR
jgi:hypothetical protein